MVAHHGAPLPPSLSETLQLPLQLPDERLIGLVAVGDECVILDEMRHPKAPVCTDPALNPPSPRARAAWLPGSVPHYYHSFVCRREAPVRRVRGSNIARTNRRLAAVQIPGAPVPPPVDRYRRRVRSREGARAVQRQPAAIRGPRP